MTFAFANAACGDSATGDGGGGATAGPGPGGTTASTGGGGAPPTPDATCPEPIGLADVTTPTAVVGDGTAGSCDEAALRTALTAGGVVVFDCGEDPVTITVTSQIDLGVDTVIDGGGTVTLSGGDSTRILHVASAWDQVSPHITVQNLAFTGGFTSDVPNTKETDEGGAAIFRDGGTLDVVQCEFVGNHAASTGQDVSGGAITSQGVGDTTIVASVFGDNSSSNGGAVGNLGNGLTVVNSAFDGNGATGTDGNPGNGGNGGAIVFDGADTTMTICGSVFTNNTAGAIGGAMFRVAYSEETTRIDRCTFDSNAADASVGLAGALYLEHTTIAMTASTLSRNSAHYGGGLWIGDSAISAIENVTITDNVADQGGGIWVAGSVTGTLSHVTLANNRLTPGGYADGLFGGSPSLAFTDSIIVGNGCEDAAIGSTGPNIEHSGEAGSPCTPDGIDVDPELGDLGDNGGPTKTMLPSKSSPAIGAATTCPETDQRGEARPSPCTLGAVEVE